jgi:hypothetical protein
MEYLHLFLLIFILLFSVFLDACGPLRYVRPRPSHFLCALTLKAFIGMREMGASWHACLDLVLACCIAIAAFGNMRFTAFHHTTLRCLGGDGRYSTPTRVVFRILNVTKSKQFKSTQIKLIQIKTSYLIVAQSSSGIVSFPFQFYINFVA